MPKRATNSRPATKKRMRGVSAADEEAIRRRAYELYLQRGDSNGDPAEDWLKAESELLQRQTRRK